MEEQEKYYDPLHNNIMTLNDSDDEVMQTVILETEEAMKFFKLHHRDYGYTYYIMRIV